MMHPCLFSIENLFIHKLAQIKYDVSFVCLFMMTACMYYKTQEDCDQFHLLVYHVHIFIFRIYLI